MFLEKAEERQNTGENAVLCGPSIATFDFQAVVTSVFDT